MRYFLLIASRHGCVSFLCLFPWPFPACQNSRAFLSPCYQQYKSDTSIFLTWLSQAAKACGYSPPALPKNDTKKECDAKATITRYGFSVREILVQAKAVAGSITPVLRIPSIISRLAARAIKTRRAFTNRFKELDVGEHANDTHRYFTSVLEEALGLLLSR